MAAKNKAKRKEAFAALKILKQQKKAEANAVDRSANPICVDRDDADSDSVKAEFKNGILSVLIPKSESSKLKEIEVEIS